MGTKSGGNKGGQTNSGAAKAGAPSRPSGAMYKDSSGAKSYSDTKTGNTYNAPKYGGASVKGLTSKDPANVARNREGASRYDNKSERIASATKDGNADKAAARAAERDARPADTAAAAKKTEVAEKPAAPKQRMAVTKAPEGYRPGIDPEYNYITGTGETSAPTSKAKYANTKIPEPTITLDDTQRKSPKTMYGAASLKMARGGKVRGKK